MLCEAVVGSAVVGLGRRRSLLTASPELLLAKTNVDPQARAETLTVEQFAKLAIAWEEA